MVCCYNIQMDIVIFLIFFLLGLVIGSFLNVVIFRLNTHKTFGGRSMCLSCQKDICWYDLVPVFSFCFLSGRCRHCKTKLSWQYPLVEFVTGIVFLLLFLKFEYVFYVDPLAFAFTYGYYATMFSLLMVISVYDIRHKIIPDVLSLLFGTLAFAGVFTFTEFVFNVHIPALSEFYGALLALPFAFFWFVSGGRWMGFGDAKLTLGLGMLVGFTYGLSAVVLAFWIGALVGVLLIIIHKIRGLKSEIPFAPFLVLGTFISFILELNLFSIS